MPIDEASEAPLRAGELLLDLDLRRGRLRRSVLEALREAIQDGRIAAGTRLPSSRRLAEDLGVSRGVTSDAYDQLAAECYLEVRPRSAPVVAGVAHPPPPPAEAIRTLPRYDFTSATPDVSLFPRRAWSRAVDAALRDAPEAALDYGDPRGLPELREALAAYLARVRGVRIDPTRVVVTQGYTQALAVLAAVLQARGARTIALETPGFTEQVATIRAAGLDVVACPVDADGLVVGRLDRLRPDAVVVTPAHQFPTGAVMTPARRVDLVAWARRRGAWIVEDDYDAEYRYDHRPIGAIQGLDPERVAHVGTASKSLAPGLRLGWLSAPPELADELRDRKAAVDSGSPSIDQLAFARLLAQGEYERHVGRARQVYRRRRDRLGAALARSLPALAARGAAAGMHVLLDLPAGTDDEAIAAAAAARDVRVRALAPLHLAPSGERGLILGYGRIEADRIDAAVERLVAAFGDVGVALTRR